MSVNLDKIYYRLQEGRLSRRTMVAAAAAAGFMPVSSLFDSRRAWAAGACGSGTPTAFVWGGYNDPHMFAPFIKKHHCIPNFTTFGDQQGAFTKLRAGFKPQLMQPCADVVKQWYDAGLLAPIDTSKLSNYPDLIPSLTKMPMEIQNGERYYVPQDWGQTSVTFRTDLAPEYVPADKQTWGILWDEKYKGRLSMIDALDDGVAAAALYVGIKDPFNLTNPADFEKVKKALERQRPLLRFYSDSATDWDQALASGELVAADSWNDSYLNLRKQGLPVAFMKPKEGLMTWVCGWVRHAGDDKQSAEMNALGYEIIDAFISAESGKWEIMNWGYGVANKKAFAMVSEKDLEDRGLSSDPEKVLADGVFQVAMNPRAKVARMFEAVKAGV